MEEERQEEVRGQSQQNTVKLQPFYKKTDVFNPISTPTETYTFKTELFRSLHHLQNPNGGIETVNCLNHVNGLDSSFKVY